MQPQFSVEDIERLREEAISKLNDVYHDKIREIFHDFIVQGYTDEAIYDHRLRQANKQNG